MDRLKAVFSSVPVTLAVPPRSNHGERRRKFSFISWTEGQESCNRGRREKSKPGTSEEDGSRETKGEAEEEETRAETGAGEEPVEGLEGV